ncbi:hypothetical protein HY448_02750, partial [Candidatus Pacearchaeota archaeon]|nr:hypothetical protein [Candidatus Pacearchaeota archaeon]
MKLRSIVIGVGIFILTLFVAIYGVSVLFPAPQYNAFCPEIRVAVIVDTAETCEAMEGKWTDYNFIKAPAKGEATGYCDLDYYCRQDYETTLEKSSKQRFLVSIPLGVALIVFGNLFFALETISVGM